MEIIKNYPTICLVHTPCVELDDYKLEPPLGLLYIATVVQNSGYYVKLIDLSVVQITEFTKAIPDQFDVYGFSTYSASYALTQQLAKAVKRRNPQALLIAGGPHATALASQVEKDFDVVVLGEGEIATLQILSELQQGSKIPKVLKGSPPELDNLPFPNFDLVDLKNYTRIVDGKKSISMLTSRGCPYKCAFCNSNIVGVNKKIRYRSPANIILELQQLKNRYNISALRIQDDLFNFDIKRMRLLAPLLAAEKINYRCFARVNTMSLEMATLLKVSGCVHVSFGVESGSPEILKKMQKGQTIAQILRWTPCLDHFYKKFRNYCKTQNFTYALLIFTCSPHNT